MIFEKDIERPEEWSLERGLGKGLVHADTADRSEASMHDWEVEEQPISTQFCSARHLRHRRPQTLPPRLILLRRRTGPFKRETHLLVYGDSDEGAVSEKALLQNSHV